MSLNKALLIGNLGRDPEIRSTPSGQMVANFSIATSRKWTDKDGQKKEDTEWHKVVVWGRQAENCKEFLHKGSQVFVEGRLQTRQWDDKDGNKRYTTEVVAQTVQFLSRSGRAPEGGSTTGEESPPEFQEKTDDDIPF